LMNDYMILKQIHRYQDTTLYLVSDRQSNLYVIEVEYIDIQAYGWIYDITTYDLKTLCSRKYMRVNWQAMDGDLLRYGNGILCIMDKGILHLESCKRGRCIIEHFTEGKRVLLMKKTEDKTLIDQTQK